MGMGMGFKTQTQAEYRPKAQPITQSEAWHIGPNFVKKNLTQRQQSKEKKSIKLGPSPPRL